MKIHIVVNLFHKLLFPFQIFSDCITERRFFEKSRWNKSLKVKEDEVAKASSIHVVNRVHFENLFKKKLKSILDIKDKDVR